MDSYEIIKSKLKLPESAPYTIQRPRVDKLIGDGFKRSFLLVVGSSGSGKTTAVANYIRNSNLSRVIYIALSKQEKDFNIFSLYLLKALKNVQIPLKGLLNETDRAYLLSVLLVNSFEKLKKDFYLVLDDFQNVLDSKEVMKFIAPFLSANLPKLHLIIVSQEKPPFELEKMILLKKGDIITEKKLRFDEKEITEILRYFNVKNRKNLSNLILSKTEGWPMGVVAAAKIVSQGGEVRNESYKWLFEEIFSSLDGETKKLLIKIAPLRAVHPSKLGGYLSKKEFLLLDKLSRKGIFLYKITGGFKLHNLFREFLRWEFERTPYKRDLLGELGYLLRDKNPIESIVYYIDAGDFDSAGDIAKENNFFSGMPYGYETIKYLMDKVPSEKLFAIPEIALMKAEVLLRGKNIDGAISIVRQVVKNNTDEKLKFKALSIELEALLRRGDYEDAISTADEMSKAVEHIPFAETVAFYYAAAKAYYFSGQLKKAEEIVNMLIEKLNIIESPLKRAKILNLYSIIFQFRRGKFDEARKTSEMLISMLKGFNIAIDPRYYVNLAMADMELGEFLSAEEEFKEAYEVTDRLVWKERIPDIDVEYGFMWLMRGELEKAGKVFEKVENDSPENPFITASLHMGKSILFRKRKHFLKALKEAQIDLQITERMGGSALVGESLVNIAKVYIAKGDFENAIGYIKRARPLLEKGNDFAFLLNLKLMKRIALGKSPISELDEMMDKEYKGMLSLDRDIIKKYAGEILETEDTGKLTIDMFGNFSVSVSDEPLSYKDFRRKGILTFFKFLLTNYSRFVSMDRIIDSLYPDLALESARHNVYVAVSVLNKLFSLKGLDSVIVKKSGMYRVNPASVDRIDFVEFENFLQKRQFLEAVKLYKGDFLEENLYDDWTMEKRDNLSNSYVKALIKASEKAIGDEKEELLKKVLEKDELNETAIFMLIKHYMATDKVGRAKKLFKKMEKKFMEEYNLPLPDEIKKLVK